MENALYVTINGIGIMLILLMLFNFGTRKIKSNSVDDRMFTAMLDFNMILLIADTLMWIFERNPSPVAGALLRIDLLPQDAVEEIEIGRLGPRGVIEHRIEPFGDVPEPQARQLLDDARVNDDAHWPPSTTAA
jgi:hypothetical protein